MSLWSSVRLFRGNGYSPHRALYAALMFRWGCRVYWHPQKDGQSEPRGEQAQLKGRWDVPTYSLLQQVRRRLWMYLNPETARCAGLQIEHLQQTISGAFTPSPAQLDALAKHMKIQQFPVSL